MGASSTLLIDELSKSNWLFSIGERLDDDRILCVATWDAAMTELSDYSQSRIYVTPTNQIRSVLRKTTPEQYQGWNAISDEIRPRIGELVETKTNHLSRPSSELKLIRDFIAWDIMYACLEEEFKHVCIIDYHRFRVSLLAKGHMACGWRGKFPDGHHVVI